MKKLLASALLAILLTGCASTRPADDASYQQAVNAVINNEQIKFNKRGNWYPNHSKITIRPIFAQLPVFDGNLTITDKAVYFMEWDGTANAYGVTMKRNLSDIKEVKLDTFGRSHLILIRTGEATWDGLVFTGSAFQDRELTEEAYQYLKSVTPETARK